MKYSFSSRAKILSIIVIILALVVAAKLFLLQVVHSNTYEEAGNKQYFSQASDAYDRGTIFFQDKNGRLVSAATQASGFGVEIVPGKIVNKETTYEKLASVIAIDREHFMARASKSGVSWEVVARKLKDDEAEKIRALKLPGVTVFKDKWRFYPGNNLAAHALGFVGYQGDELAGRYGLERQYETKLSRDENSPYVNFFAEVFGNIKDTFFSGDERRGDLITTIEPVVQGMLEGELAGVLERYRSNSAGGIIMNPKTGAIYAMAVLPDFDLNSFSESGSVSVFSNPLVENVFEFGSVVKPLVMAAGLDAGVITADTAYNDTGSVLIEDKQIFNFDRRGRGEGTTMQDVLSQSLNTGMVLVYQKLGRERMRDYMYSFGIKEKTGIDLPNETNNLVANLNSPRHIEYSNASFGQGIALTPVSLVRALSALGNGGVLPTPHLGDKIRFTGGFAQSLTYSTQPSKISAETSEEITRMMVITMDQTLRSGAVKLPNHSIAVKTGTAQIPDPKNGGYYADRNMHSFFGYFPAYDPEFIVLLYAIYPKGVRYASETWTDPFLNISKFLINYYDVPPDR